MLISDLPALREASEDAMPALDPFDLRAWRRKVTRLCAQDDYLEDLRERARAYRGSRAGALGEAVFALTQTHLAGAGPAPGAG